MLQGALGEGCKGLQPLLKLIIGRGVICRRFLGAQTAGAVLGVVGDFRTGVCEPFGRRHFGITLRWRGCRLGRCIIILYTRVVLR